MGVTNLIWIGQLGNKAGSSPFAYGGGERTFFKNMKLGKIKSTNWAPLSWSKFIVLSKDFLKQISEELFTYLSSIFWSMQIFCFDGWVWVEDSNDSKGCIFPFRHAKLWGTDQMCVCSHYHFLCGYNISPLESLPLHLPKWHRESLQEDHF